MKTLTQKLNEAKERLDIQDDTINFIDKADLNKYLTITDKFISQDAKDVVKWLIANNATYVKDFGGENALASFYDKGVPKDASLKDLYKKIGKIVKAGRTLEIPVFQTEEQFNGILTKKISPDEILLDLTTEAGRNKVARQYDKLVWKIAHSFEGKSNLSLDELYSAGLEGLTRAMNSYGKKVNKDDFDGEVDAEEQNEKIKSYTFLSYAAFGIRNMILHDIKNVSHIVRIPVSAQQKEKAETGRNTKNNTISGDDTIGSDGEKTRFDFMAASSDAGLDSAERNINNEDMEKIWKEIFAELEKKFDDKTMDIWYSFNEINGRKKMKNKELAEKYGVKPSNITYYLYIVNNYILKTPSLREKFSDLKELIGESHTISDNSRHVLAD